VGRFDLARVKFAETESRRGHALSLQKRTHSVRLDAKATQILLESKLGEERRATTNLKVYVWAASGVRCKPPRACKSDVQETKVERPPV